MRAGLSELRAHCTEGGEKGRAGECAQEDDLGKSSLGGKARGGLEASKPPGEARTRPQPRPLCGTPAGRASAPQSYPDLPF